VDFATRYATDHPADERASQQVARSNFLLAWSLPAAESIPAWEQALAYYENELKRDPASATAQRNAALVAKYLGGAFETLGQHDRAAPHYARAVELDEARLRALPDDRGVRLDAAISVSGLAALAEVRGDLDEADRLFERSLAIRRSVVDADRKDVQAHERLGYALYRSGKIRRLRGNPVSGRAQITEAVQLLTRLLETTKDWTTQKILAEASVELGRAEISLNNREAACDAFRQADRYYRDTVSRQTESDKARSADAAREVAACR
jgi:tetratricopeptide (TPR) repeat protein